ncbi:MAG: hypothetical protein F6K50_51450 [Moorea sp. SIO3I7]|nr:hypothetical protein [Moorena sp. SIO3I7]
MSIASGSHGFSRYSVEPDTSWFHTDVSGSQENYIGQTPEDGCPTNYRGAVSITNTIILHKEGMDTLDRGFDAAGNLVWGAKDLPYQFRWVEPQ